ncbi:calcium-binding protein [Neptunicoccus cionae]|uniref:Calcium-binding protein n=1 Tax=Neptunicoccus cionae TaxID=2035344 RepID=A0A916R2N0_9RHOB|nr:calcium-binding protein [Amylibacter cionae]GGA29119.1 hypothetical protein GCM10011498_32820 [Amylibacter cionae]
MKLQKHNAEAAAFAPEDTLVFNSGTEDYLKLSGGDKSITMTGSARIDSLKFSGDGGMVEASLDGTARISYMNVSSTDLDLVMNDSSRVRVLQYYDGEANITTGNGYVALIETWEATISLKTVGGVGTIDLGSESGGYTHKITTTDGWVSTIKVGADATILKTGEGGVGTIRLGAGNDKVTTGGGVNYLDTGGGNDKVKLHAAEGFEYGFYASGGEGVDLLDLSNAKNDVEYEFNDSFHYVESVGYFLATGFENIKGSKHDDHLTGDSQNNLLIGGKGNDRLEGAGGDDVLKGGGGRDTFVFGYDAGTDKVKGYSKKQDTIAIEGHSGGFKSLDISVSGRDKVISHDNGTIILVGHDDTFIGAGSIDFI